MTKTREQQIEDMAAALNFCKNTPIEECHSKVDCKHCLAEQIYEAGYHKIPTTDWLTKGISEEELEREKQEALAEFAESQGYTKIKHGEWVHSGLAEHWRGKDECSECHYHTADRIDLSYFNYCPNCGAKMKEADEC